MTVEIFSISVFQFHITHSVWPPKCQILFVGLHIPKSISQQELMQNLGQTEWNMGNCYISQLVRTLWLANLAGHTLLYGLLNSKVCFSHHAKWKSTLHTWAINPRGKNLVRNLQYGPPTWLVRAIYKMRTTQHNREICVCTEDCGLTWHKVEGEIYIVAISFDESVNAILLRDSSPWLSKDCIPIEQHAIFN